MLLALLLLAAVQPLPDPVPVPPPVPPQPRSATPAAPAAPAERARTREGQGIGSFISQDDYPAMALRRGAEGTVGFRLTVGRDGRVSHCAVTRSSGDSDLDKRTCTIMTARARFVPARDRSGAPAEDVVNARVSWRLEDDDAEPRMAFAPFRHAITVSASAGGRVRCTMQADPAPATELPEEICRMMFFGGREPNLPAGARAGLTIVTSFTPAGSQPQRQSRSATGTLVGEAAADIMVDHQGAISGCRVVSLSGAAQNAPDFCQFLQGGGLAPFEPSAQRQQRGGRIHASIYSQLLAPT